MGESKRRKQLDINFGLVSRNSQSLADIPYSVDPYFVDESPGECGLPRLGEDITCFFAEEAIQTMNLLMTHHSKSSAEALEFCTQVLRVNIFNQRFEETLTKSQGLLVPWFNMASFAQIVSTTTTTKTQAIDFWENHWKLSIPILGKASIADPHIGYWLRRLKGVTMFVLDELRTSLDQFAVLEFLAAFEQKKPSLSMGETTIEIGLAFGHNNIIYAGEGITVYKGKDDTTGRGELMIAVKHASGCWNHYPSPDNVKPPLLEYKKAKSVLGKFPISLRGELIHPRSEKLAKLLGLTVKEGYAYLIKA